MLGSTKSCLHCEDSSGQGVKKKKRPATCHLPKTKSTSNINVNPEAKNKAPNIDKYIRISFLQWLSVVKKTVWIPLLKLNNNNKKD